MDAKLKEWAVAHPRFRYVPVLSDPMPEDQWQGRTGFVHDAAMADFADLSGHDIYLSGPPPMVNAAKSTFPLHRADPLRIYSDSFDFPAEVRAALEAAALNLER
jgi:CDP-4-dehydro-6-deoxyglucose reductase